VLQAFLKFLGGEPGLEKHMWLLLGKGFFMGIFLATYQVGSESLFIQRLGEDYLDVAFFVTGFLGILSTVLFVNLQARIKFSTLVVANIFVIFLFVACTRSAFEFLGEDSIYYNYLPFILFVMMGPITAITLLGFWGVFGRMFDNRQAKKIIGGIDTGQLFATIIAFFSIPLITQLPYIDETYDLLFVSGLASFGILFFTIWIIREFHIDKATRAKSNEQKEKVKFTTIFKDPYTRLLSLFLIFSMAASVFMDYTFYSATETMFPIEEELNTFLSFFNGTVILMSFFIQSFINDIIIGRFGLKVSLMTMPIILILFTLGILYSGYVYGYETKNELYILFFVFAASGKAFTASLKDALESPAFKLFFLPFDIKIRFDIQTRIEGVVNEFATLIAGAIQIGLGALVFFKLIHFAYFIIIMAGVVIYLASKLYDEYKVTLKQTLERQKADLKEEGTKNEHNTLNVIKSELKTRNLQRILNALRVLESIDPLQYEYTLLDLLSSKYPKIRQFAYRKLQENQSFTVVKIIKAESETEGDEQTLEIANEVVVELENIAEIELNDEYLRSLVRSTKPQERITGAKKLAGITEDRHLSFIIELLRDINPDVRKAALITAGKVKRPELWPILVENLHSPTYGNAAMSSLINIGEPAFHTIDTSFYKTGQYESTMLRIIQIFGRINIKESSDLLWKKIEFPNKRIVSELLVSLSYHGFQARDFQAARIKIFVENLIGDLAWNIKALKDIPEETELDHMIIQALEEENRVNYDNIFMLMAMIYDAQSVMLVRENIYAQTVDSIMFAVEMLDVFLDEEMKPKVIPVMDDLKVDERLAKLQNFFPPEDFENYEDLLRQIINRDYNRITRYTKLLALERIRKMEEASISNDLIANLFNPDKIIRQTAANVIYTIDKQAYQEHSRRLKQNVKKELDRSILPPVFIDQNEEYYPDMLEIDKVITLKKSPYFNKISGDLIVNIAEVMDEIRVTEGTRLIEKDETGDVPVYLILEGTAQRITGEGEELLEPGMLFGYEYISTNEKFDYQVISNERMHLLVLRKEEILDLMSKHIKIMEAYLRLLNGEIEVQEEKEEEVLDMDIL